MMTTVKTVEGEIDINLDQICYAKLCQGNEKIYQLHLSNRMIIHVMESEYKELINPVTKTKKTNRRTKVTVR